MKVTEKPRPAGKAFTVDIQVGDREGGSHTYQMPLYSGERLISHNSVSLLAGATPGIHYPTSKHYIRRVRLMKDSQLVPPLIAAGYKVEPCEGSEKSTVVVEFPISLGTEIRTTDTVSIWEKLKLTEFIQKYWADNQVSVTIDFDAKTEGDQIKPALDLFQYDLKSVSFLPRLDSGGVVYNQAPYEPISEEKYNEIMKGITPPDFSKIYGKKEEEAETDLFCDSEKCLLVKREQQ